MVKIKKGSLFSSGCQTLVNAVNCVGVMGAGIALEFRLRYPKMFNKYKMLSPDGICYSFDSRANGYCRSEGIGVVILESTRICDYGYCKIEGIVKNLFMVKASMIMYHFILIPKTQCCIRGS